MVSHIYLVPGFLGFAQVGDLPYFWHVREELERELEQAGLEATIETVDTHPSGSIWRRTQRLLEVLAESLERHDDEGPVHLIGHSTGGLDARLLLSPGVTLSQRIDRESVVSRVRSVVTVASPHQGTPGATFLNRVMTRQAMNLLALIGIYLLTFGRIPVSGLVELTNLLARFSRRRRGGKHRNMIEEFHDRLLADFSPERREVIEQFFHDVRMDQRCLLELTPKELASFNAAYDDRPGVRYGSVVLRGRRPGPDATRDLGRDPYRLATHQIYRFFNFVLTSARRPISVLPHQARALERAFGDLPTHKDHDGMVPTLSQAWGDIIHATAADHLDVIGHFDDHSYDPPHIDWLTSATPFTRADFEALWRDVAVYVAEG